MSYDPKLVKYNVKCPSRRLLVLGRWFGWLMSITGIGLLGIVAYRNISQAGDDYSDAVEEYQYCKDGLYAYNTYIFDDIIPKGWRRQESLQPACVVPNKPWFEYINWHYGVIVLVIGIILAGYFGRRFRNYYVRVRQGKIIKKDIVSGGSMYSHYTDYLVLVEGYTYADELDRQWKSINAGAWHDGYKTGDYIDLR